MYRGAEDALPAPAEGLWYTTVTSVTCIEFSIVGMGRYGFHLRPLRV